MFVGFFVGLLPVWVIVMLAIAKAEQDQKEAGVNEEHDGLSDDEGDEEAADAPPIPIPPPGFEPLWILPGFPWNPPKRPRGGGRFGVARPLRGQPKTRRHTGVDLGAPEGAVITAPEDGRIVAVQGWQGSRAKAIMFEPFRKDAPFILFGAVKPGSWPPRMLPLVRGMKIGEVGVYPRGSTMLHIEAYQRGTKRNKRWIFGKPAPAELLDVTPYLEMMVSHG